MASSLEMATEATDANLQAEADYDRILLSNLDSTITKRSIETEPDEVAPDLIETVIDWQYMHGSLLKIPPDTGHILARPIGVAVFPTPFPEACFEEARELQRIYNLLYIRISEDESWLRKATLSLVDRDSLIAILWKIYDAVRREGYHQDVYLGLFRSDYMLHQPHDHEVNAPAQLKQIEFNTYSVAGGVHSARISKMHKYLSKTGAFNSVYPSLTSTQLPDNPTTESLAAALISAHGIYGKAKSAEASTTGVLFVVQPNNVNICDERPIEEVLWESNVPSCRLEFPEEILSSTSLSPEKALLLHKASAASSPPLEISVIYLRAGYDEEEYVDIGIKARIHLEKSTAIKCPSLLSQIANAKKVQQELTLPGQLEHFLFPSDAARIRTTFAPMYPLDDSPAGKLAADRATNPQTAQNYVLKPSLEGGGNNIYGADIPSVLSSLPKDEWKEYILMELLRTPPVTKTLLSPRGLYHGETVSELGVFGACMWRRRREGEEGNEEREKVEVIENRGAVGFSFKTKGVDVQEMSVVKGYGCFDSPVLV